MTKLILDGIPIKYSFADDYSFNIINGVFVSPKRMPILYNGTFKKYTFTREATGSPFEVFIMTGIGPNASPPIYVDNDTIHVYTEKVGVSGQKEYTEFHIVKSLIEESSYNDNHCEVRVNENKEYEVKFGDGIHGKKLTTGTIVSVIYLSSNGVDGMFDTNGFSSNTLNLTIDGFATKDEMIKMVYGGYDSFLTNYSILFSNNYVPIYSINYLAFSNMTQTSQVLDYENVDNIKEFAPFNFRLGNRLVTANDYKTYILSNFKNRVRDVYVCNNNEYCSLFYKWLDTYDSLNLNIRLRHYEYANACDFNNIYLWFRPLNDARMQDSDNEIIIKSCDKLKSLTTQIIPCEGIKTYFMPYIKENNNELDFSIITSKSFENPTRILIAKGITYLSDNKVKLNVAEVIINYFKEKISFGETIIPSEIEQRILALGYIDGIKTVSDINDNGYYKSYYNGLSFARMTKDLIDYKDFVVFTQSIQLEKFQYAVLLGEEKISSMIEIANGNSFALKNDEF